MDDSRHQKKEIHNTKSTTSPPTKRRNTPRACQPGTGAPPTHQRVRQRTVSRVSRRSARAKKNRGGSRMILKNGYPLFVLLAYVCKFTPNFHCYRTVAMGGRRYRAVALSALLSAPVALAWSPAASLWRSGRDSLPASSSRTSSSPWTRSRTVSRSRCCAPVAGSVEAQQVDTSVGVVYLCIFAMP